MSLISIIIPVYNMAEFLPDAVQSIFDNDYPEIEVIIVDDGSEDNTLQVAEDLAQEARSKEDISINVISIDHTGIPTAQNTGLKAAKGAYITFLDADDTLPPDSLSIRMETFKADNSDIVLGEFEVKTDETITGKRQIVTEDTSKLIKKFLFDWKTPFHLNCMLIRKEIIKQTGFFDENLYRSQEIDYAIRILKTDPAISFIHHTVYCYSKHRAIRERLNVRFKSYRVTMKMWAKNTSGGQKIAVLAWRTWLEGMKFIYEIFSVYKK